VRLEIPTPPGAAAPRPDDPRLRLNELDLSAPVVRLDRGLRGMGAPGAPEHGRLMQYVFHTAGLDPDRFRGYRVRMSYPVPMIIMGWWIPLPEKD
jgi:hypothetical protein